MREPWSGVGLRVRRYRALFVDTSQRWRTAGAREPAQAPDAEAERDEENAAAQEQTDGDEPEAEGVVAGVRAGAGAKAGG